MCEKYINNHIGLNGKGNKLDGGMCGDMMMMLLLSQAGITIVSLVL
jgi:hypothetical protein